MNVTAADLVKQINALGETALRIKAERDALRAAVQLFLRQWNACGANSDFGRYFKNVRDAAVDALTCKRPLEENEHGALCGDEGRLCYICAAAAQAEHAYLRGQPRHAVFDDAQAHEERNQELRDAGRGHLVRG